MLDFIISLYLAKDISMFYQGIYTLTRYGDLSLTEIENLIPYEMEIYTSVLNKQLEKEKKK